MLSRGTVPGVGTPMWCPPATWTLSWLGLLGLAGGATAPLPGHSIPNPPDVHHLAKLWQLTGRMAGWMGTESLRVA